MSFFRLRLPEEELGARRQPFPSHCLHSMDRCPFESSLEGPHRYWSSRFAGEVGANTKEDTHVYMRSEVNRLQSFPPWVTLPVSAVDFAKSGLYYVGPGDEVHCFSCGGILDSWAPGDDPMKEHERFFPDCSFVLGREVKNGPRAQDECRRPDYLDGQILGQLRWMDTGDSALLAYPAHPDKGMEWTRLSSFRSWPLHVEVQPQQLARAGFFYTGHGDCVKCFYCDGSLRDWEEGDDPWTEHVKWFPTCSFLQYSLGPDFVVQLNEYAFEGSEPSPTRSEEEPETSERSLSLNAESAEVQLQRLKEERMCKICMDNQVSIVFIPCGHLVCEDCAPNLTECPICRAQIQGSVKTFMS